MTMLTVPQNIEAEMAVLGSILENPTCAAEVASLLKPEDFYRTAHQTIYRAILAVHEKQEPPDLLLVCAELDRTGKMEQIGGASYLTSCVLSTPTAVYAANYAGEVLQSVALRRLLSISQQIAKAVHDGGDADKALEAAYAALADATPRNGRDYVKMDAVMEGYIDRLDAMAREGKGDGVPSGFVDLDTLTGGFQKGELTVLAGRPGHGKSACAMQIAAHAAAHGATKGYVVSAVSLEMSQLQLIHRMVSGRARVDGQRLRTGWVRDEEWPSVHRAVWDLAELPIYLDDTPGQTIGDVRNRARRLAAQLRGHGQTVGLMIVDYLQLMHATVKRGEGRTQEVGLISGGLKEMAMELGVPVIACAQLNRAVESRQGNRPQLSDLRESGSIEQDADLVLFVHREELYDPKTTRKGLAELIVAKNRSGPLADITLRFDAPTTTFYTLSEREAA